METSTSLLDRLRQSPDDEARNRLDRIYRPLLRGWLERCDTSLGADVEDLAQEILIVVFEEVANFNRKGPGSFRKWLWAIMRHRLLGHYRKRRALRTISSEAPDENFLAQLADDRSELAQRWEQEHNEHVVRRLLELIAEEFSDLQVRAFRRHVLDQVSASEVAEELGVTNNVVLLAKSRILKHLRQVGKGLLD